MAMAVGQRVAEEEPTALSTTGSADWHPAGTTAAIAAAAARALKPVRIRRVIRGCVDLIRELGNTGKHQAVDGDRLRQVAEAHHRLRQARKLRFRHLPGRLEKLPFAHELVGLLDILLLELAGGYQDLDNLFSVAIVLKTGHALSVRDDNPFHPKLLLA